MASVDIAVIDQTRYVVCLPLPLTRTRVLISGKHTFKWSVRPAWDRSPVESTRCQCSGLGLDLNICNKIWISGDSPSDWRNAIVIPIPNIPQILPIIVILR